MHGKKRGAWYGLPEDVPTQSYDPRAVVMGHRS